MADLPDIVPPAIACKREPLRLVGDGEGNLNELNAVSESSGTDPEELDSLHPVFSESSS